MPPSIRRSAVSFSLACRRAIGCKLAGRRARRSGASSRATFPAARAGGHSLTARISQAGNFAIRVPRKSGRFATTSGSIRPTRRVFRRSVAGGTASAALLCGDDGRGSDIMTDESFADYQLHLEFTVPKGSNSGVYNRGLFEIQVFDSLWQAEAGLSRLRFSL